MTSTDTAPVSVITGASSGIGEATARALTAAGYRVALLARRADRIEQLAGELGASALAVQADVTVRDSLVAAADQVRSELGGADVLVNNAGVMLLGPFSSAQRADHRQMVEVNLMGAMAATEVFLDQLRDGGGDLVNISSVAGRTARPGNAGYAATKWGINGWSDAAPRASARHPRDGDRAGRRGDRADRPHHARRDQGDDRGLRPRPRDPPGGHRRDHRVRRHAPAADDPQRDPRSPDRTSRLMTLLRHRFAATTGTSLSVAAIAPGCSSAPLAPATETRMLSSLLSSLRPPGRARMRLLSDP
jgi:NADP-dependent 3-hydroxy acid dehydrogenase YdfG